MSPQERQRRAMHKQRKAKGREQHKRESYMFSGARPRPTVVVGSGMGMAQAAAMLMGRSAERDLMLGAGLMDRIFGDDANKYNLTDRMSKDMRTMLALSK